MRLVRMSSTPRGSNVARPTRDSVDDLDGTELTEPRTCPDCELGLIALRLADRKAQYCPACQGMWLPRESAAALVGRPTFARWHPATEHRPEPRSTPSRAFQLRLVHEASR